MSDDEEEGIDRHYCMVRAMAELTRASEIDAQDPEITDRSLLAIAWMMLADRINF